jgi:hypothetical protein
MHALERCTIARGSVEFAIVFITLVCMTKGDSQSLRFGYVWISTLLAPRSRSTCLQGTAAACGAFAATLLDDAAGVDEINGATGGPLMAFGCAVAFGCACLLSDCSYLYASGKQNTKERNS